MKKPELGDYVEAKLEDCPIKGRITAESWDGKEVQIDCFWYWFNKQEVKKVERIDERDYHQSRLK